MSQDPRDGPRQEAPAQTLGTTSSGDVVEELLRFAGPRPDAPAARFRRVARPVRAVWLEAVATEGRRRRRRRIRWAVAAAVVAVVAAVGLWRLPGVTPVARVERLDGSPGILLDGAPLGFGSRVGPGTVLDVPAGGRVALRLVTGASLRLKGESGGTRVRVVSPARLDLERGTLYLDRPSGGSAAAVTVRTDLGTVREIGTQLEVRRDLEGLRVRVREGAAEVLPGGETQTGGARLRLAAGEELRLDPGGAVARGSLAPWDPAWRWVQEVAPLFDPEGRTLAELLAWVERETGRRAELAPELPRDLLENRFHGAAVWRSPDRAPEVFLPTFGLQARRSGDGARLEIHPEPLEETPR